MGKAAKFKKLRRIANQLPPVTTKRTVVDQVLGSEVPKAITEDQSGNAIDPEKMYRREQKVDALLNHYKMMKKNFYKAGMAGAAVYAHSVQKHVNQKQNKKPLIKK